MAVWTVLISHIIRVLCREREREREGEYIRGVGEEQMASIDTVSKQQ